MEDDPLKMRAAACIAAYLSPALLAALVFPRAAAASPVGPADFFGRGALVAQADEEERAEEEEEAEAEAAPSPTPQATPAASPEPSPVPAPPAAREDDPFADQRRVVPFPPLLYYDRRPDRDSEFFMLGMLWWSADNPDRRYKLFLPFFYSRWNKQTDARTFATPLWYYYSSPQSRAIYGLFIYHERGKGISRTGVPPLFWYGRVDGNTTSYLFPIYFYEERDGNMILATPLGGGWGPRDDRQYLILPFFYARRANTEQLKLNAEVFFPVYWHFERPGVDTRVVLTAFFRTRYAERATKRVWGVAPFFYRRTSSGGSSTTITPLFVHERKNAESDLLATPIGGWSRRPGAGIVVLGPWIDSYRTEGDRSERFRAFVPLFFHGAGKDGDDEYSWTVAGTYLHRTRKSADRRESMHALFPIFFRGSGESERERYSWTVLGPYFDRTRTVRHGDGTERERVDRALLPLFWYGRDGRDLRFVSPIAFFHRDEDGDFRGLFGPFYRSWSKEHQTWVLFPLAWHHRGPRFDRTFGVLPFYYARTRENDTYAGFVPLFFYRNWVAPADGKRRRSMTLLPVFHFSERPGHLTFLSLPYVQIRRPGERQVMAGLLWWDHRGRDFRKLTFLPFFHWNRERESRSLYTPVGGFVSAPGYHKALWLLWHQHHDERHGIRNEVLFPVYWNLRNPERKLFVLGAYYHWREGKVAYEGLVPFWWRSEFPDYSQSIIFPLLLYRHDKLQKTRAWFTPLGGVWKQEEPDAWRLLAPLVYLAHGPQKRTAVLFPLFFYDFDHGRQTIVAPLFYTRRDDRSLTVAVVPALYYKREPGSTVLLTPGVFYSRSEDRRTTVVLPVYWSSRDRLRSRGVLGLWFWDQSVTRDDDFFRLLFPVFAWTRKGSDYAVVTPVGFRSRGGTRTMTAFLPGLGWATRADRETGETVSFATLFGPLYVRTAPEARDVVLFPLFWHTKGRGRTQTAIVPLFHHTTTPDGWRFLTLGGGGARYQDSSWVWLLNFVYARERDRVRTAFVPLFFLERDPRRFQLLTPLFYHVHDSEARTSVTIAPLFYRRTSPQRDQWVGFPLLWHDHDKVRDRTVGGVLPIALWGRDGDRGWWAAPLLLSYRQKQGENHLRVHGPLVDVKVAGRRTVALIPIFRYHRDAETDTASLASLPFIWWVRRGEHTRAFVGIGYWNTETGTRVWPGYGRWQSRDAEGNVKRSIEVALPFYVRDRKPSRDILIAGPYYRSHWSDGTKVAGFGPFWWQSRNEKELHWKILGFLVEYDRYDTPRGRERQLTILLGFKKRLKTIPIPRETRRSRPVVAATTREEEEGVRAGAELFAY